MLRKFTQLSILSVDKPSQKIASALGISRTAVVYKNAHRAVFEYNPRPGYLYVRSRAISSRCNDNYDEFPAAEIEAAYKTFLGKPVFVNHHNEDHRTARGVIIDAALHKDSNADGSPDTWVEVLMEVDAIKFPKLAKAIVAGHVDRTSMGCDVGHSICSACGNKATTPAEYCSHVPQQKGAKYVRRNAATGKPETTLIREICYKLAFFENSLLVEDPADPTAYFLGVDDRGLRMSHQASLGAFVASSKMPSNPSAGLESFVSGSRGLGAFVAFQKFAELPTFRPHLGGNGLSTLNPDRYYKPGEDSKKKADTKTTEQMLQVPNKIKDETGEHHDENAAKAHISNHITNDLTGRLKDNPELHEWASKRAIENRGKYGHQYDDAAYDKAYSDHATQSKEWAKKNFDKKTLECHGHNALHDYWHKVHNSGDHEGYDNGYDTHEKIDNHPWLGDASKALYHQMLNAPAPPKKPQSNDFKIKHDKNPSEPELRSAIKSHVDGTLNNWAGTSGDSDSQAIGLQFAAQKHFGTDESTVAHLGKDHEGNSSYSVQDGQDYYEKHKPFLHHFIDSVYKKTQDELKDTPYLSLHRGHNGSAPEKVDKALHPEKELPYSKSDSYYDAYKGPKNTQHANVNMQPLSSWSSSKQTSSGFSGGRYGHMFHAVIPREKVFSLSSRSGPGCYSEHEVVVIGGKGHSRIEHTGSGWNSKEYDKWRDENGMSSGQTATRLEREKRTKAITDEHSTGAHKGNEGKTFFEPESGVTEPCPTCKTEHEAKQLQEHNEKHSIYADNHCKTCMNADYYGGDMNGWYKKEHAHGGHVGYKENSCPSCQEDSKIETAALKQQHNTGQHNGQNLDVTCPSCKTENKSKISEHNKNLHTQYDSTCFNCKSGKLQRHDYGYHDSNDPECSKCTEETKQAHTNGYHYTPKKNCPSCQEGIKSDPILSEHIKNNHPDKDHPDCNMCNNEMKEDHYNGKHYDPEAEAGSSSTNPKCKSCVENANYAHGCGDHKNKPNVACPKCEIKPPKPVEEALPIPKPKPKSTEDIIGGGNPWNEKAPGSLGEPEEKTHPDISHLYSGQQSKIELHHDHIIGEHKGNSIPFNCPTCKMEQEHASNVAHTMGLHDNAPSNNCPNCNQHHINETHNQGLHTNKADYNCKQCAPGIGSKLLLQNHAQGLHDETPKPGTCLQCSKDVKSQETHLENQTLSQHIDGQHSSDKTSDPNCPACKVHYDLFGGTPSHWNKPHFEKDSVKHSQDFGEEWPHIDEWPLSDWIKGDHEIGVDGQPIQPKVVEKRESSLNKFIAANLSRKVDLSQRDYTVIDPKHAGKTTPAHRKLLVAPEERLKSGLEEPNPNEEGRATDRIHTNLANDIHERSKSDPKLRDWVKQKVSEEDFDHDAYGKARNEIHKKYFYDADDWQRKYDPKDKSYEDGIHDAWDQANGSKKLPKTHKLKHLEGVPAPPPEPDVDRMIKRSDYKLDPENEDHQKKIIKKAVGNTAYAWNETSSGATDSVALQMAAKKHFGLADAPIDRMKDKLISFHGQEGWDRAQNHYKENKPFLHHFLDSMYNRTQDQLKDTPLVHLHRGHKMANEDLKSHAPGTHPLDPTKPSSLAGLSNPQPESKEVQMQPLSSWSASHEVAKGFTSARFGHTLEASIPREHIVSLANHGVGVLHEKEAVVLGGKAKVRMHYDGVGWKTRQMPTPGIKTGANKETPEPFFIDEPPMNDWIKKKDEPEEEKKESSLKGFIAGTDWANKTYDDPTNSHKLPSYNELNQMKKIHGPLGSNGGQWFQHENGSKYLLKRAQDHNRAQNEIAAGAVYRHAGINFPNTSMVHDETGHPHIVSEHIPDLEQKSAHQWHRNPELQHRAAHDFGTDALLSHWDVHGLEADNTLVNKHNHPVRIESGGAMAYRAMGGAKPNFHPKGDWVEHQSMRHSEQGSAMYGDMSDHVAHESLKRAGNIDMDKVHSSWKKAGVSSDNADKWRDTLKARQAQIPGITKSGLLSFVADAIFLDNPTFGGKDWYHGTTREFKQFSNTPPQRNNSGEEWNTSLGTHLTSHPKVTSHFTKGSNNARVIRAQLNIQNPKRYDSEADMGLDAIKVAKSHGIHIDPYKGMKVNPKLKMAHTWQVNDAIGEHPQRDEVTQHFKDHLENSGHDGIVYHNDIESPNAPAAIAFHPHQIEIKDHHWNPGADEAHKYFGAKSDVCPKCHGRGGNWHEGPCELCQGERNLKRFADLDQLHSLWGSNDINKVFKGGVVSTSLFPPVGGLKGKYPYEKDKVTEALKNPEKYMDTIDPRTLKSTQPNLTRAGLEHYMNGNQETFADKDNPGNSHPFVYSRTHPKTGNVDHILLAGHHRAASALLKGETLRAIHVSGGFGEK